MEEAPLEAIPALNTAPKRPINKRFVYLVLTIIVLFVAFFSYKIFGTKGKAPTPEAPAIVSPSPTESISTISETPTETLSPTLTPTLTPMPTLNPVDQATGLDRSELSVTIENGSGEAGVAGKASDVLKHLGYNVVATDNADNFDYANVSIQVKAGSSDFLTLLRDDLGTTYTIGSTSADLSDGFSSDALVIIGK